MLGEMISDTKIHKSNIENKLKKINIICPVCKANNDIEIPESIISQNTQLTTISIPEDLVCKHHFQAFIDKQFKVRGYQKVDFALPNNLNNLFESNKEKKVQQKIHDDDLFKSLILEGNYVQYIPKNSNKEVKVEKENKTFTLNKTKKSLEEIYEEFWEFIDDNNKTFQDYILKDKRRSINQKY